MARKKIREYDSKRLVKEYFKRISGSELAIISTDGHHTTTQMGSGRFPEEGFGKSSYFRNIQVVDKENNLKSPKDLGTFTEQSNCYDVQTGSNSDWGHYFYYGGPGKNPNCP